MGKKKEEEGCRLCEVSLKFEGSIETEKGLFCNGCFFDIMQTGKKDKLTVYDRKEKYWIFKNIAGFNRTFRHLRQTYYDVSFISRQWLPRSGKAVSIIISDVILKMSVDSIALTRERMKYDDYNPTYKGKEGTDGKTNKKRRRRFKENKA